jgi:hypothetical protein
MYYRLQITDYKLQITNYKLQITKYKLDPYLDHQLIKCALLVDRPLRLTHRLQQSSKELPISLKTFHGFPDKSSRSVDCAVLIVLQGSIVDSRGFEAGLECWHQGCLQHYWIQMASHYLSSRRAHHPFSRPLSATAPPPPPSCPEPPRLP